MKGLYIYNGGLITSKFLEIRDLFVEAFAKKDVLLDCMTNESAWLVDDFSGYDFCLFYDKDIPLCLKIEQYIPVFNSASAIALCDDKCLTASVLEGKVRMPKQVSSPLRFFGETPKEFLRDAVKKLSLPLVLKCAKGSFGEQVRLIHAEEELYDVPAPFLLQEYIEANGEDIRIYIVDGKYFASFKRKAPQGDFRSNITNGGTMLAYTPTESEIQLAISACKGVGAFFAGVDIIGGENPVLLEVNTNAHFKNLLDFTGLNYADEVVSAILRKV